MKVIALHVDHRERGDAMQDQVMTMQDQIQTSSRPDSTLRQNRDHKARASSTVIKACRVAGFAVAAWWWCC
jgi:hypothetical protein